MYDSVRPDRGPGGESRASCGRGEAAATPGAALQPIIGVKSRAVHPSSETGATSAYGVVSACTHHMTPSRPRVASEFTRTRVLECVSQGIGAEQALSPLLIEGRHEQPLVFAVDHAGATDGTNAEPISDARGHVARRAARQHDKLGNRLAFELVYKHLPRHRAGFAPVHEVNAIFVGMGSEVQHARKVQPDQVRDLADGDAELLHWLHLVGREHPSDDRQHDVVTVPSSNGATEC